MKSYIKEIRLFQVSTKSEFDAARVEGRASIRQFLWDASQTMKDDPFFEIESDVLVNDGTIRR